MDTTILVKKHIEDGTIMLKHLFSHKWKITVAFWNKNQLSKEWKLYLAIPVLKQEGSRSIYLRITKRIMLVRPKLSIDIDDVVLIHSTDSSAKEIRNKLAHNYFQNEHTTTIYIKGNDRISGETICYNLPLIKLK